MAVFACVVQVVIEEGDVLYLPAHWFHYIVSLSTNIQVRRVSALVVLSYIPLSGWPCLTGLGDGL